MTQGRHVLDDYRLEKVVRSTPHTTVFRALDPSGSRRVIIKLVYPAAASVPEACRTAFLDAADAMRRCAAPGLPTVIDYGLTPDDQAFLVMDMRELAVPVSGLLEAPARRRVGIARRVADAAAGLAAAGISHLNLRSDNLLVAFDESVLLTGFGTAAYRAGAVAGAWPPQGDRWSAPELSRPDAVRFADLGRADLYSLALVICDLLGAELADAGAERPLVRLPEATVEDRAGLEAALAAALDRDPARRSGSAAELQRLLVSPEPAAGEGPVGAPPELEPAAFETRAITVPLVVEPATPVAEAARERQAPPARFAEPAPSPPERAPDAAPEAAPADPEERASAPPAVPRAEEQRLPAALPAPAAVAKAAAPPVRRRWGAIAGLAAGLVLVSVVGWLAAVALRSDGRAGQISRPPIIEVPRPVAAPSGPAVPAVNPILTEAERLLFEGNPAAVRALLEKLPEGVVASFNSAEAELHQELVASIGAADREEALRDLDGGLESGSITMLRRAVPAFSGVTRDELAADPALAGKLERARRALSAFQRLRDAERAGDPFVVIERAGEMIAALPGYSRAATLREEAAVAVEERAESEVAAREFEAALAALRELERRWPQRPGLAARIEACERELRFDAEMESLLQRAVAAGERGDPEEGLRQLAGTSPSMTFAMRVAALRERLEDQLAKMDAGAPVITIPDAFEPVLRKNETAVVPIEVRDDYRVERVAAWVSRDPAAGFQEIRLSSDGGSVYPLAVTPELHGNDGVLFYVVATDRSGHSSTLGSAEQPLRLERKGWLKRLTGGGD
jgi:hypothetical protein